MITTADIPKSPSAEQSSQTVEVAPSDPLTDYLGIKNGEFSVQRSGSKRVETGWEVTALNVHEGTQVVTIEKGAVDAKGRPLTLRKEVPVDTLRQWQQLQGADEREKLKETLTMRRRRELFAPPAIEGMEDASEDVHFDADYLFGTGEYASDNYENPVYSSIGQVPQKESTPFKITPSQEMAAMGEVSAMLRNPTFTGIVERYLDTHATPDRVIRAIREHPDLRMDLGEYFIQKAARYSDAMPPRVGSSTWKSLSHRGYEAAEHAKVTSEEYVARLCLAMLDGTYNQEKEQSDPITYDHYRRQGGVGQHRYAAKQLLLI